MTQQVFEDSHPGYQTQQSVDPADGRKYSPNRDFAWVGPALFRQALSLFSEWPVSQDSPYGKLLAEHPDQDAAYVQLGNYARFLVHVIRTAGSTDEPLMEAVPRLRQEFARDVDWRVELAVLARVGEMLTGCVFAAIKDVTPAGGQPPHQRDIESLVRAAEKIAADFRA